MRGCLRIFVALALFIGAAAISSAQETTGTITGTVADSTGAVLPGVTIAVKNVQTGRTWDFVSTETGTYTASLLPPGTYEVTFSLQGFQPTVIKAIELHVNDRLRIDGKLGVTGVTESVEVSAACGRPRPRDPSSAEPPLSRQRETHGGLAPRATSFVGCRGERRARGIPVGDTSFKRWAGALVALVAMAACSGEKGTNGSNGTNGTDGTNALVRVEPEAAGTHCPYGGVAVRSGLDANANGALDPGEVTSTSYVCGGADRVYAASAAPWGGLCPRGAVRLDSGIDADGDGVLDPSELDAGATRWICDAWFRTLSAGARHACASMSDGTVRCWGADGGGQLGDGRLGVNTATAVTVNGLAGAVAVVGAPYRSSSATVTGPAHAPAIASTAGEVNTTRAAGAGRTAKAFEVPVWPSPSVAVRASAAAGARTSTGPVQRPHANGPAEEGTSAPVRSESATVPLKPVTGWGTLSSSTRKLPRGMLGMKRPLLSRTATLKLIAVTSLRNVGALASGSAFFGNWEGILGGASEGAESFFGLATVSPPCLVGPCCADRKHSDRARQSDTRPKLRVMAVTRS